jgi:hypothetical protein
MVQVPAIRNVAVVPDTPQTVAVVDVKATANPELAVAARVSGVPTVCVAMAAKVMLCGFPFTVKLCETGVAAR